MNRIRESAAKTMAVFRGMQKVRSSTWCTAPYGIDRSGLFFHQPDIHHCSIADYLYQVNAAFQVRNV